MRNIVATLLRRQPERLDLDEPELLFDEGGLGFEAESVPTLSSPRWGRAMVLPVVVLFCVLSMVYLQQRSQAQRGEAVAVKEVLASDRALAVHLSDVVSRALGGEPMSVIELRDLQSRMDDSLRTLRVAATEQGPAAFPVAPLDALEVRWRAVQGQLSDVAERSTVVQKVSDVAGTLEPQLESAQTQAAKLFAVLADAGGGSADIAAAGRLTARLARMSADAALLGQGADPGGRRSRRLAVELDVFVSDLGRLSGVQSRLEFAPQYVDTVAGLAARLETQAPVFVERTRELISAAPGLSAAREVAAASKVATEGLIDAVDVLDGAYRDAAASRTDYPSLFDAVSALTIILVAMFALQVVSLLRRQLREARAREEEVRERNRRNQDAILQLLDEISHLADGDLTKHTTVTEEITGAVADAVNYAIDALRDLVARINKTSQEVASSAQTTRARTSRLSRAADTQTSQIAKATGSMQAMADAERVVSDKAIASSDVARRSVEVASKGAVAVRETISGMGEIRDGIQDTSKRLKRLGESSQEIGNIVGLIDDIADQTNVLALNAAIQASMAGEAGRGFGVVADEVQRLAERARQATKRIEVLVNTIQADTHEAIASMEKSTSGVVSGAHLAEDAGGSLEEIETVSKQLAARIHGISDAAAQQAQGAEAIAASMLAIQKFAVQVRSGTNVTANSAGRLAELAQALEGSVSRFRLPSTDHENVVDLMPGLAPAGGASRVEPRADSEQERDRGRSKV